MLPKIINRKIKESELRKYCYLISEDKSFVTLSLIGCLTNFEYNKKKENYIGITIVDQEGDVYKIKEINHIGSVEEENVELEIEESDIDKNTLVDLLVSTFIKADKSKPQSLVGIYIEKRLKEKLYAKEKIKEVFSELNKDLSLEDNSEDYMPALSLFFYNKEVLEIFEKEYEEEELKEIRNKDLLLESVSLILLVAINFIFSSKIALIFLVVFLILFFIRFGLRKFAEKEVVETKNSILINDKLKEEEYYEQPCIVKVETTTTESYFCLYNYIYKDYLLKDNDFKEIENPKEKYNRIKEAVLTEVSITKNIYYSTMTNLKSDICKELEEKIIAAENLKELIYILET